MHAAPSAAAGSLTLQAAAEERGDAAETEADRPVHVSNNRLCDVTAAAAGEVERAPVSKRAAAAELMADAEKQDAIPANANNGKCAEDPPEQWAALSSEVLWQRCCKLRRGWPQHYAAYAYCRRKVCSHMRFAASALGSVLQACPEEKESSHHALVCACNAASSDTQA